MPIIMGTHLAMKKNIRCHPSWALGGNEEKHLGMSSSCNARRPINAHPL
jgi:hypothetical protein